MHRVYSRSQSEHNNVVIDWNLGNRCSMQCGYCHPEFRNGSMAFPPLDNAMRFVDAVMEKHRGSNSNRVVAFSFVGGEPTEWDGLIPLCRHIKEHFATISVMSNGAAPLDYWSRLSRVTSRITLTHHEGQIDFEHFADAAQIIRQSGCGVSIQFAMQPESFDISLAKIEKLRAWGFHPMMQALYRDHTVRQNIMPYTESQLQLLFPSGASDVILEGDSVREFTSTGEVIHRRANSFTGMKCGIGTDQLCISPNGDVRGGWCRVGGILGNVHAGQFEPPAEPIICTKATCNNPSDLAVPKWRD